MPARDFLEKFQHDPTTFDFDQFKAKLLGELTVDDDLTNARITQTTAERDTLATESQTLKARLWDATVMQQGTPVVPNDSPPVGGAPAPGTVPESDIFATDNTEG